MSVKYRVVQRGNPSKPTAPKKFYAQPFAISEATLKSILKEIASMTTVNSADAVAVIDSFVQIIIRKLANGEIVRLGDLGSFQLSFSSEGADTEDKLNSTMIKGAKILYRPGSELKNMLATLSFEKES